ncbi:hypothetical protein D3H55_14495 [Bacillus salacetis]|uniref:Uncharacterized protein n=1 Tax=Bacillus salacetis TaxID=2315464 RepID=A0A3A1QZH0_9BACI|nr:hypothetical protein [Bacillus salacetis]RIW31832.1 hypothetical protein D3H55_14495 [Bacillus salacetis]
MKLVKILIIIIAGLIIGYGSYRVSKDIVECRESAYEPVYPPQNNGDDMGGEKTDLPPAMEPPQDIDRLISHSVDGTGTTDIPVDTEELFVVHEGALYVRTEKEAAWMKVPDDEMTGYARISDYLDTISQDNIYVSEEFAAVVYGGRGSENISIIRSYDEGVAWSVGSISKTATHDLKKGYDQLYIGFSNDTGTGYLAAFRNTGSSGEIHAYRSVNNGVTWDPVTENDQLYPEVLSQFGLKAVE